MMKNVILSILGLLLFGLSSYGQDILVKNNGDKLPIKIIEVQKEFLKYYKISDAEPRIYTTSFEKLLRIEYEDGNRLDFAELIQQNKEAKLQQDMNSLRAKTSMFSIDLYNNGKKISGEALYQLMSRNGMEDQHKALYASQRSYAFHNVLGGISSFVAGWQLGNALSSRKRVNKGVLIGSSAVTVYTVITATIDKRTINRIVKEYNKKLEDNQSLSVGFTNDGYGISLIF